jgi:hypothetical protein
MNKFYLVFGPLIIAVLLSSCFGNPTGNRVNSNVGNSNNNNNNQNDNDNSWSEKHLGGTTVSVASQCVTEEMDSNNRCTCRVDVACIDGLYCDQNKTCILTFDVEPGPDDSEVPGGFNGYLDITAPSYSYICYKVGTNPGSTTINIPSCGDYNNASCPAGSTMYSQNQKPYIYGNYKFIGIVVCRKDFLPYGAGMAYTTQ